MKKFVITYSFKQEKVFDNELEAQKFADMLLQDPKDYENVVFHTLEEGKSPT